MIERIWIAFRSPCGCARAACIADGTASTTNWVRSKRAHGFTVEKRPKSDAALLRHECSDCAIRSRIIRREEGLAR